MKTLFITVVLFVAVVLNSGTAWAMPGAAHDSLAQLLLDTPPEMGGAKGLSLEQIDAVNRWIDNPATKTGQYTNKAVGKTVHPTNHGHLRHNPTRVARVMSGDGTVNPAKLNVARLHKIADVANNKAGVDGWKITAKMKQEAQKILDYVTKNGRLPEQLPNWVDDSGPILTDRAKSIKAAGKAGKTGGAAGMAGRLGKAVKTGGAVTIGRIIIEGGIATIQYSKGNLSTGQYEDELVAVGIKAVGSGVLTSAAIICFTNPGTAVVFVVAVGACIVVDVTYGAVKEVFDDSDAWEAFYNQLPRECRQGLLVDQIAPDPGLKNFGRTYGPALSSTSQRILWEVEE